MVAVKIARRKHADRLRLRDAIADNLRLAHEARNQAERGGTYPSEGPRIQARIAALKKELARADQRIFGSAASLSKVTCRLSPRQRAYYF